MLTLAGEKLTFRLRMQTFRSILWQKIEWFDRLENSVGALCFRLSSDASEIQGATGARIGFLVHVSVSICLLNCFDVLQLETRTSMRSFRPICFAIGYAQSKNEQRTK